MIKMKHRHNSEILVAYIGSSKVATTAYISPFFDADCDSLKVTFWFLAHISADTCIQQSGISTFLKQCGSAIGITRKRSRVKAARPVVVVLVVGVQSIIQ